MVTQLPCFVSSRFVVFAIVLTCPLVSQLPGRLAPAAAMRPDRRYAVLQPRRL